MMEVLKWELEYEDITMVLLHLDESGLILRRTCIEDNCYTQGICS